MSDSEEDFKGKQQEREELIKKIERRYPDLAHNLRTSDIRLMCDKLLQKRMFHRDLIEEIFSKTTTVEKARCFIDSILKADLQHIMYFMELLKDIMPTIHHYIVKAEDLYEFANRQIRKTIKKLENSNSAKSQPEISQLKNMLEEQLTSLSSLSFSIQKTLLNIQITTPTTPCPTTPTQTTPPIPLPPQEPLISPIPPKLISPTENNQPKNNQKCHDCKINEIKIENLQCNIKKISSERDNYYKIVKVLMNELGNTCENNNNNGLSENIERIVSDKCKNVISESDLNDLFRKISIEKRLMTNTYKTISSYDDSDSDSSESDIKSEPTNVTSDNNIQPSIIDSEKPIELSSHSESPCADEYIVYTLDVQVQTTEIQQQQQQQIPDDIHPYDELRDTHNNVSSNCNSGGGGVNSTETTDSNSTEHVAQARPRRPAMKKPKPNSTSSLGPPPLPTSQPPSRSLSTQSSITTIAIENPLNDAIEDFQCLNFKSNNELNNNENK